MVDSDYTAVVGRPGCAANVGDKGMYSSAEAEKAAPICLLTPLACTILTGRHLQCCGVTNFEGALRSWCAMTSKQVQTSMIPS